MDVRCAFVLLLALVVTPCSGKPTEKAQPTTGGPEVEGIPIEPDAERLLVVTTEAATVTEVTTDSSSGIEEATTNSAETTTDLDVTTDGIDFTTESGIEVTTDALPAAEVTTDSGIEVTTDPSAEDVTTTESGIEVTTDSASENEVTTDSGIEVTTNPSLDSGIEFTTDLSAGIKIGLDKFFKIQLIGASGIEITTESSSAEADVTTDEIEVTTNSESGIEVMTDSLAGIDIKIHTTDLVEKATVNASAGMESTTDSVAEIEITTDLSAGVEGVEVGAHLTSGIEVKINRSSRIQITTDSPAEIEVLTDPSAGIEVTTDPSDETGVTTDSSGGIAVTTDSSIEIEITTDPSSGIEVTTDSLAGIDVTTDALTEVEVTTLSSSVETGRRKTTTTTTPAEEEIETVTPIIFPEGPEATTFLAQANYFDDLGELTTESLMLEATTENSEYSATTDYPDFPEPVKIPALSNNPLIKLNKLNKLNKKKNYEGYRVLRVLVVTNEAIARVLRLEDVAGVTFWADPKLLLRPRGRFVTSAADIMVSPAALPVVEDIFRQGRLIYTVLIENVQEAIAKENIALSPFARSEADVNNGHKLTWQRYHRLSDIDSFLVYLGETYPDLVDVIEIGQSSQGRPIKLVKIGRQIRETRTKNKKSILIDAGVHGNEWITTSSVTWMLNELSSNSNRYDCILERFDWLWIPLLNPDGYEYAHTVDRMWRKTRRNYTSSLTKSHKGTVVQPVDPAGDADECVGADINRNFEFYWRKGGSSSNLCSASFAGIFPFSEPESRALANYVLKHKKDIAMYISLHAYSQMWLLPWGFSEERPKDFSRLFSLAKIGATALQRVHNTSFLIGSVPDLLYRSSGNSQDWVKAVAGVEYSYTVEMRDAGESGRILPSKEIVDSSEETWAGIYAAGRELATRLEPFEPQCPSFDQ